MSRCLEPLSKGVAPRLGSEAVAFTRRWFTANTMSKPKLVAIGDCLVAGGSPPENGTKSA